MIDLLAEQKRRQLLDMLDRGLVMVHLDPRREGVIVPEQFRGDPVLRLNIAYGFNLPALDVGEEGVYAILSFSRQNFGCTLPWDAIFALTSPDDGHDGVVWPSSAPPEFHSFFSASTEERAALKTGSGEPSGASEDDAQAPARPFAVHEGGGARGSSAASSKTEDERTTPQPVLKLVKG